MVDDTNSVHRTRRYAGPVSAKSLDDLPALLRMSDVTVLLDCHERTIREHIATGRLPGFKLGREFRFKRDDVLALLRPINERDGVA